MVVDSFQDLGIFFSARHLLKTKGGGISKMGNLGSTNGGLLLRRDIKDGAI
jgi:hypothetical protein